MNALDPLHWTQNSCLGPFGPFRYCTKVDAKLVELAPLRPKFTKRSSVGIFRNERTWSTKFDPKLKFWVFQTILLLHEGQCKTSRTGANNT
jgi:hypothetical protein